MISFVCKLEDMLRNSGYEDWEIMYIPDLHGYILKLDGEAIYMTRADKSDAELEEEEKENGN